MNVQYVQGPFFTPSGRNQNLNASIMNNIHIPYDDIYKIEAKPPDPEV
jgi:hypothetical protein